MSKDPDGQRRPRLFEPNAAITKDPLVLPCVDVWGGEFVAPADALGRLCESVVGPGWRLASRHVYFDLCQVRNRANPTGHEPGAAEIDGGWSFFTFRILVRSTSGEHRAVVTHAFTDSDWAMIYGREVFGFPVLRATFQKGGGTISIWTDVLRFEPGPAALREVIRVQRGRAISRKPPARPPWLWPELLALDQWRGQLEGGVLPVHQKLVQLKQARDAVEPSLACFSDHIRGTATARVPLDGKSSTRRLGLTLIDGQSSPLAADLGMSRSGGIEVTGYELSGMSLELSVEGPELEILRRPSGAPFRFRPCDPLFAPDFRFENVETTGFRLPVAYSRLEQICERRLNEPFEDRGYRFVPANVELILEYLDYGALLADHPPPGVGEDDASTQRELVFRMLVGRVDDGNPVARAPAVFTPFLFVDSVVSLITGREVAGYPKQLAQFKVLPDAQQAEERQLLLCEVTTQGLSSAASSAYNVPLLTIDCRERRNRPVADVMRDPALAREALDDFEPVRLERVANSWWSAADLQSGGAHPEHLLRPWARSADLGYAFVQVKGLPEAKPPRSARYFEQLEGDYILERISVAFPRHRAHLHFGEGARERGLLAELGLSENIVVPPGSWYRSNSDFRLRILDPLR